MHSSHLSFDVTLAMGGGGGCSACCGNDMTTLQEKCMEHACLCPTIPLQKIGHNI